MKRPTYQWLGQMFAALGVIISLCLVAYELKQSREAALAEVYQSRAAMDVDIQTSLYASETLQPLFNKIDRGEGLTREEHRYMLHWGIANFVARENAHYQYSIGLLPETEWEGQRASMEFLLSLPCFSEYFRYSAPSWRREFLDDVEDIVAAAPEHQDCGYPDAGLYHMSPDNQVE